MTAPPPFVAVPVMNTQLETLCCELHELLNPFRISRMRGHYDLRFLLEDPESRPDVLEQAEQLRAFCERLPSIEESCHQQLDEWRSSWATATPEWQNWVLANCRPFLATSLLEGLRLMRAEAVGDLEAITIHAADAAAGIAAAGH